MARSASVDLAQGSGAERGAVDGQALQRLAEKPVQSCAGFFVSAAIMHHPSRAALLPGLLAAVGECEVVTDPDPDGYPSPWRTHREALERTPERATHRLIVQDDAVPVPGFDRLARAALLARPEQMVTFFVGGQPWTSANAVREAGRDRKDWALLPGDRWIPCVALAWPVRLIEPALAWIDEQRWREDFRADDEIVGRAMTALGERVLATVPSLVEHPDVAPSVIGRRAMGGRDAGRVACCPPPEGCDLAATDWSDGP